MKIRLFTSCIFNILLLTSCQNSTHNTTENQNSASNSVTEITIESSKTISMEQSEMKTLNINEIIYFIQNAAHFIFRPPHIQRDEQRILNLRTLSLVLSQYNSNHSSYPNKLEDANNEKY